VAGPATARAAANRGRRRPGRGRPRPDAIAWIAGCAAAVPLAWIIVGGLRDGLGADPIEALTLRTGWWALTLLVASLAVTPLRRLTGWNRLVAARRPLGLAAFGYATLHVAVYLVDREFTAAFVVEDVMERPFVTAGLAAFLLLVPLAATSTRGMIRRLGPRWQALHRLVYPAAALAVLHFLWLVKADLREPLIFALVLGALLAVRLVPRRGRPR
jgi:methionine sulfoxide reductase heme-binding subunit